MRTEMPNRESLISWTDPAELASLVGDESLDGLAYLNRIVDGTLPNAPAIEMTGSRLVEVEAGRAKMIFSPELIHCNAMRQIHGGVIATLLDSAIGYAVVSTLSRGEGFSTLQLNVNFIRGLAPNEGKASIVGRLVRRGRRIIVAEADLISAVGKLCANATATCLPMGR